MKKVFRILLLTTIIAVVFSGCGDKVKRSKGDVPTEDEVEVAEYYSEILENAKNEYIDKGYSESSSDETANILEKISNDAQEKVGKKYDLEPKEVEEIFLKVFSHKYKEGK
ncbi:hypothetical protein [Miniphocaeibacter massiliensis]|uniref:hypothetical protein n=1 Tax=Miniphocaeibacter massiliensis TaxID=2041841 RepID=UPI000C1B961A|nr:hypothetical protein [Miniphocaeibacter massiliensis]